MKTRELGTILITIVVIVLAAWGLAACTSGSAVKDKAVKYVAEKGNTYCQKRGTVRDLAVNQINAQLADAGAKWRVVGIACEKDNQG